MKDATDGTAEIKWALLRRIWVSQNRIILNLSFQIKYSIRLKIIKKKPNTLRDKMDKWLNSLKLSYNYLSFNCGIYFDIAFLQCRDY